MSQIKSVRAYTEVDEDTYRFLRKEYERRKHIVRQSSKDLLWSDFLTSLLDTAIYTLKTRVEEDEMWLEQAEMQLP